MQVPFSDNFDYEGKVRGIDYCIRVAPANTLDLIVECYFRFPQGHQFHGVSPEDLDATLPETVSAFYGNFVDKDYWVGLSICPDRFEDAVVFAESFLEKAA